MTFRDLPSPSMALRDISSQEIVLNSVAIGFVFELDDLLYKTVPSQEDPNPVAFASPL